MVRKQPKGTGGDMTVRESGKRGGSKTASTHGHENYKENGRRGGEKTAAEHHNFFKEIGRKSGACFYSQMFLN